MHLPRYPWGSPKEKDMTVCIAAACDNGERIVTATDGLLSMGDVTGEGIPGKMLWYGDWQFMYAGTPSIFSLVMEEIENASINDPQVLSRRHVQETILHAYQKVRSRLASFPFLSPFNMTIEDFKQDGLNAFGETFHNEVLRAISDEARRADDQLLVTGWGMSPLSAMVYEVGPSGDRLHTKSGFGAIGSGSQMAYTMLILLEQARYRTLAETIFNVACAKFFSEKSKDLDVGKMTAVCVLRKRTGEDEADKACRQFVSLEDLDILRSIWDQHLRPRIPDEARIEITGIAARVNAGNITPHDMVKHFKAQQRINEKRGISSQAPLSPQSTKDDS